MVNDSFGVRPTRTRHSEAAAAIPAGQCKETLLVDYAQQQRSWGKHLPSIALVVLLHIILGYALVSGLAPFA